MEGPSPQHQQLFSPLRALSLFSPSRFLKTPPSILRKRNNQGSASRVTLEQGENESKQQQESTPDNRLRSSSGSHFLEPTSTSRQHHSSSSSSHHQSSHHHAHVNHTGAQFNPDMFNSVSPGTKRMKRNLDVSSRASSSTPNGGQGSAKHNKSSHNNNSASSHSSNHHHNNSNNKSSSSNNQGGSHHQVNSTPTFVRQPFSPGLSTPVLGGRSTNAGGERGGAGVVQQAPFSTSFNLDMLLSPLRTPPKHRAGGFGVGSTASFYSDAVYSNSAQTDMRSPSVHTNHGNLPTPTRHHHHTNQSPPSSPRSAAALQQSSILAQAMPSHFSHASHHHSSHHNAASHNNNNNNSSKTGSAGRHHQREDDGPQDARYSPAPSPLTPQGFRTPVSHLRGVPIPLVISNNALLNGGGSTAQQSKELLHHLLHSESSPTNVLSTMSPCPQDDFNLRPPSAARVSGDMPSGGNNEDVSFISQTGGPAEHRQVEADTPMAHSNNTHSSASLSGGSGTSTSAKDHTSAFSRGSAGASVSFQPKFVSPASAGGDSHSTSKGKSVRTTSRAAKPNSSLLSQVYF